MPSLEKRFHIMDESDKVSAEVATAHSNSNSKIFLSAKRENSQDILHLLTIKKAEDNQREANKVESALTFADNTDCSKGTTSSISRYNSVKVCPLFVSLMINNIQIEML